MMIRFELLEASISSVEGEVVVFSQGKGHREWSGGHKLRPILFSTILETKARSTQVTSVVD